MKIIRAKVFGFGKWVDFELDFPKDGPAFIFGENESGKSTFHQFILFMLFGMPPKQRKLYQPKTSSKLGGQLMMEDPEIGEFTIERFDDKNNGQATCFTSAGESYDESWLKELLHGMDGRTFEAIFSFSALDLNAIKEMREEELGDVLLSIGLTGSSNIYRIEKQLEARLGELFKPSGKNPAINKQLQVVQQLAADLEKNKTEEAMYREKISELNKTQEKLETLQNDKQAIEEEHKWLAKKHAALPIIQEHQHLSSNYQKYTENVEFPTNGMERLEKLKEAMRPLESELAVLRSNEQEYRNTLAQLETERLDEEAVEQMQEMKATKERFSKLLNMQSGAATRKAELSRELTNELAELQIDLDREELDELSLPFYIEETWKQLKEDKRQLAQEKVTLEAEKNSLLEEERFLEQQQNELQAQLLTEQEATGLKIRLSKGREFEQFERLYEATTRQQETYGKDRKQKLKRANQYLVSGILLSLIIFIVGLIIDQPFVYGLGVIVLVLSIASFLFTKQNVKEMERLFQTPPPIRGQEKLPADEVYRLEKRLQEEEERHQELKLLQSEIKQHQVRFLKWEEKQRIFLEKNQRHSYQLEEQRAIYPFLESINVSYWPDYFSRLKNMVNQYAAYKQVIDEIDEVNLELQQLETQLVSYVNSLGGAAVTSVTAAFESIEQRWKREEERKQRITHVTELLEGIKEKQLHVTEGLAVYRKEVQQLFQLGNSATEEAFHQRAIYLAEKEKLEEALAINKRQLRAIFPGDTWLQIIEEELDELELKNRQEEMEKELKQLSGDMDDSLARLADVNAELKRMESSEVYSIRMHQFEMEKEKLNQLAREWAIIKMEKEVLTEAKQRYQEKYLSRVIEETTSFLKNITAGRYVSVFAPAEDQPFQVMTADGLRYTVSELSQGTMNLLYVSLRLAISKVLTENKQLPFIVDDAFVHFDQIRVKRMVEVLDNISQTQQVIMFTCKSDVYAACNALQLPVVQLERSHTSRKMTPAIE